MSLSLTRVSSILKRSINFKKLQNTAELLIPSSSDPWSLYSEKYPLDGFEGQENKDTNLAFIGISGELHEIEMAGLNDSRSKQIPPRLKR
ncbi:hypothetical protein Trydic_g15554 [Trypoxylus dichotomus]